MECTIRWAGPDTMSFIAETGSGHSFVMDGAPEGGGRNLGPRPMEALLSGAAACTAYDVVLILRKSGMALEGCEVVTSSERASCGPQGVYENSYAVQYPRPWIKGQPCRAGRDVIPHKVLFGYKNVGLHR
jgi:uncharacterized OsmC-like protein